MQIAQILSGYSLGEADLLRRAMGKKIKAEMDTQRVRFVDGAMRQGVTREHADTIFDLLAKFADYGFNKSHAAAYALVAYQTAYMKAHYPVEFIAAQAPGPFLPDQHGKLVANALAQARALMMGVDHADAHRACPGNRPSTFMLLRQLDPAALGALIALYEHRVFVCAALWGINPFDQWGVELGKQIAKDVTPRLATGDVTGLDASTADLIARLRG